MANLKVLFLQLYNMYCSSSCNNIYNNNRDIYNFLYCTAAQYLFNVGYMKANKRGLLKWIP